jgi:hypothetical protein
MEITTEKLRDLLSEAFDAGYENSQEFKGDCIDEILARHHARQEEQYRVFKVAELRKLPEGTIFHHSTRGRCWLEADSAGGKYMMFANKGQKLALINDTEPWDRPMKLLHSEKKHV